MKPTALQFSFCVSLACHAAVFGAIAMGEFGPSRLLLRAPAGERDQTTTLTMISSSSGTTVEETPASAPLPEATISSSVRPAEPNAIQPEPMLPEPTEVLPAPPPVEQSLAAHESDATDTTSAPQETLVAAPVAEVVQSPSVPVQVTLNATPTPLGSANSSEPTLDTGRVVGSLTELAKPKYLKTFEPPYPPAALRRRQEGLVLLSVEVSVEGRAARVEVKESSGFPLLDDAAIRHVRRSDFEPARRGSIAVDSEIELPMRFKLTR